MFALDTPTPIRINLWESCLSGWFVPTPADFEQNRILGVVLEGAFVPALYGIPRPDVALHLNDSNLVNSGFYVRFRGPKRKPLIRLVTQGKSDRVVLTELSAALVSSESGPALPINSYEAWLNCREPSLFWPENELYDRLSALPYRPLVSVLLPTFGVDPFLFQQCVQSVLRQKYARWQLCISDDGSNTASVEPLQKLTSDDRITITFSPARVGAAEAQNLALNHAQGDFIVTLGQNDELHPCALLEVIRLLNQRNGCEAIYSDEDKIDAYGARSNPIFKADIDPDMLLASDYVGRLAALRRTTVLALGGFRSVCDGAQEWDLLVRLLEESGPQAIQHLPKPLYHRRISQAQPQKRKASLRVLWDHVARTGKPIAVQPGLSPNSFRLKEEAPQTVKAAVFFRQEDGSFQISTVSLGTNRGREISLYQVKDCAVYPVFGNPQPALLTLSDISAEVLIFINRPLESLNHLFFEELTAQAIRPECGLVTGISVDVEKRVLHSGLLHSTGGHLVDPYAGFELSQLTHLDFLNVVRSVEMISDRFFAIRREHLSAVGGLSAVSAGQMQPLVHKLVTNANRHALRVIVTPFAIAGFHQTRPDVAVDPVRLQDHNSVALNPNLLAFEDLAKAMRGVF